MYSNKQASPESSGDYRYLTLYNRAFNYIKIHYLPHILLQGTLIQREEKKSPFSYRSNQLNDRKFIIA